MDTNDSVNSLPSVRADRLAFRRANQMIPLICSAFGDASGISRHKLDRMNVYCTHCGAQMWIEERKSHSSKRNPKFEMCCHDGAIRLSQFRAQSPELVELLEGSTPQAVHFRNNIRAYNSAFSFTSSGARFDHSLADNRAGVYTYRVQGQVYHLISSGLLPSDGADPKFA